jgi:hypothetical protein
MPGVTIMFGEKKKGALADQIFEEALSKKKGAPVEDETEEPAEDEEGGDYDRKAKVAAMTEFREAFEGGDDEAAVDALDSLLALCGK